jgi:deoxyribose-phosphate aldolase
MKALDRKSEWNYMKKIVSQAPQYLVFAVCIASIALAVATGALRTEAPAPIPYVSSEIPMLASAGARSDPEEQPPTF